MSRRAAWFLALLVAGFAAVTADVLALGPLTRLDRLVFLFVQEHVEGVWRQVAGVLRYAGHRVALTTPLGVLCVLVALRFRSVRPLVVVFVVCVALVIVVPGIKIATGRTAPHVQHDWLFEPGTSFPSGHAVNAIVLWGTLLYLARCASRRIERTAPPRLTYALVAAATAAAGLGKVGMGYHWLTDVLAGWLLGTAMYVALLAWDPFRPLRERRDAPPHRRSPFPTQPGHSSKPISGTRNRTSWPTRRTTAPGHEEMPSARYGFPVAGGEG